MIIYVSAPYGKSRGASPAVLKANVDRAIRVARELIKMGFKPYVPHLLHFIADNWKDSPPEDEWYWMGSFALECCDAVLMTGKWKESDGCLRELRQARLMTKKVFFSLDELKGA